VPLAVHLLKNQQSLEHIGDAERVYNNVAVGHDRKKQPDWFIDATDILTWMTKSEVAGIFSAKHEF